MVRSGRRAARVAVLAATAAAAPLLARPACADPAVAEALFVEARRLAADGRYAEACPRFEESLREAPGIGAAYNLADCWEHLGRTASAWGTFQDVAARARLAGQPEREQAALERAARLAGALCRLRIDVAARPAGLVVTRDGRAVGDGQFGLPVPVDPGPHVVEAAAPGFTRRATTVEVGPCPAQVTLTLPALTPDPLAAAPAPATPAPGGVQRTVGWSLLGGAAALGVLGGVALAVRQGALDGYNEDPTCPGLGAAQPPACQQRIDREKTWATVAVAGFAAAGALGVASGVLLLTAPSRAAVACGPWGCAAGGRF